MIPPALDTIRVDYDPLQRHWRAIAQAPDTTGNLRWYQGLGHSATVAWSQLISNFTHSLPFGPPVNELVRGWEEESTARRTPSAALVSQIKINL